MAYLLDANVFIDAKSRYYGFDFCPAFWDWLIANNAHGLVLSIEKVGDEMEAGDDALAVWVAERGDGFFVKPEPAVLAALGQVGNWATGQAYAPTAITAFLEGADCYLIAHALAGKHEVVTLEIASASKKRIKIPNACIGLGVKCLTPFEMLRRERARFVLGTAPRRTTPPS